MKLITWNIQWGLGIDRKLDLARVIAHAREMADFDVLCLQEVADGYDDLEGSAGENQFADLAALAPGHAAIAGVAVDVPHPKGGRKRFGNMILSRLPVGRVIRHALPWRGDGTANMPRVLIEAVIETGFGPVRIMTTHLEYSSAKLRAAQVEGIRAAHDCACEREEIPSIPYYGPFTPEQGSRSAIVTGDFNMRPDDPSKLRMEAPFASGAPAFVDSWSVLKGEAAHPPSFCIHDQRWGQPHCCDFVFVTQDLAPRLRHIAYDVETQISDHQPVLVELD